MLILSSALVWNYRVLQYAVRHSFDLQFILLNAMSSWLCTLIIRVADGLTTVEGINRAFAAVFSLYSIPLGHTLEGIPISYRKKLGFCSAFVISRGWFLISGLLFGPYPDYDDVEWNLEMLQVSFSMKDIILIIRFNIAVFWMKKLVLLIKHPDCIIISTYPRIIWMKTSMRLQTLSSVGNSRAATLALDIYTQSVRQNANIYLFEDNTVAHRVFSVEGAQSIHRCHYSKGSHVALVISAMVILAGTIFHVNSLLIVAEILCSSILMIGPLTFDIEMMRFYLKSFDFWFKWFNWTIYVIADAVWNHREFDMNGLMWAQFASQYLCLTIIIFYIICIDAYHVPVRFKKCALFMLMVLTMYYQFCNVWSLFPLTPWQSWNDTDVILPLGIKVSLRSMMMSSLGNFIVFMGRQLVQMVWHPGTAAMDLYPQINWIGIGDNNEIEEEHKEDHLDDSS